jgi:serine/threonine protein kinase/tetratricopeptide (TPR) repeat protein
MHVAQSQAKSIFGQALAIDTAQERAAFLDQACAGDQSLRAELESLLAALDQAGGDFLKQPALALGATADLEPEGAGEKTAGILTCRDSVGDWIGPYRLLEQIGEGGMGLVFMAEQHQPMRRKVALKVLKPGMDTRQVVARFEAERQALALMDHPNIARVFDGGVTLAGRPYFVMELVRGVPITEYCDQYRLAPRQRLELFALVCQAVQHAHQKGIIHRDLKPSNVLVTLHDTVSVPKVIDFGIAKAIGQPLTERTLFTQFSQLVGTPLYMSPEQAEMNGLDVDTRADVYALGVLLYELLTGGTPFESETLRQAGLDEIRRIIREDEPPRPSQRLSTLSAQASSTISERRGLDGRRLARLLRGELDWIVMKALEKDRNRRYETASAFALDIQRYLTDEPVRACPPSALYRARKFGRRNKRSLAILASALIVAAVFAGTVGAYRHEETLRQERRELDVKLALRDVDHFQAEKKWAEALAAAKQASSLLQAGRANQELRKTIDERIRDLTMASELAQIFADTMDRLAERQWATVKDPEIDSRYLLTFQNAGIDVEKLKIEEAAEIIRTREIRQEIAVGLDAWAVVRQYTSGKADPLWRKLRDLATAIDPDPFRILLRKAICLEELPVADGNKISSSRELLDQTMPRLVAQGMPLLQIRGKWHEVLHKLQRQHPDDFWLNFELGSDLEAPADHLRFSTAAVAIRPGNAGAHAALGLAYRRTGRLDEAIAEFQQAIQLKPENAPAHRGLAELLAEKGMLDEAIAEFQKAIQLHHKGEVEKEAFFAGLAGALALKGQSEPARSALEEALKLAPRSALVNNQFAWFLATHADAKFRNPGRAVELAEKVISLAPGNANFLNTLGVARYRLGKWKDSITALSKSVRLGGGDSNDWFFLAMAHWQLGQKEEARKFFSQAVHWMEKNRPARDSELGRFRAEAAALLGIEDKPNPKQTSETDGSRVLETFVGQADNGGMKRSAGLAIGPDGNLYVGSIGTNKILRFDGKTGKFLDTFVEGATGVLDSPAVQGLSFRPDGKLYVLSRNSAQVRRFDAKSGAFVDVFIPPCSGGLTKAKGMTVGPDGNWYVSSATNQILRFSGTNGAFLGSFVTAASGGLNNPRGLIFGPDGNLYVASSDSNAILRFNGQTGAYLNDFVAAGSGGLRSPGELLFSNGSLYVSSQSTGEVLRFDAQTGQFLDEVIIRLAHLYEGITPIQVQLDQPVGLLLDAGNCLFVGGTEQIHRYGLKSAKHVESNPGKP